MAEAADDLPEDMAALKAALIETRAKLSGAQANAYDDATMTRLWQDMNKITPLLQEVKVAASGPPLTPPPTTTDPLAPTIASFSADSSTVAESWIVVPPNPSADVAKLAAEYWPSKAVLADSAATHLINEPHPERRP